MNNSTNWWRNFFTDNFADLLLERKDQQQLNQEIDFIYQQLQLKPGDHVFDQCCGIGSISHALALRHLNVIGVDLSENYIKRAQKKADSCTFIHADALEYICKEPVDAALNWYTSFGYSDNDAINRTMLHNAYRSLKPGGRFILDYTNPAFIFANFKESITYEQDDFTVLKTSQADLLRGMYLSHWQFTDKNGEQMEKSGESRIYFARDLTDMLQSCGFIIIAVNGNCQGAILTKDSPRCIITAEKISYE